MSVFCPFELVLWFNRRSGAGGSGAGGVEAYLRVLEDAGKRHLIALYAGALGENAVERYALFLVSLGLEADGGE